MAIILLELIFNFPNDWFSLERLYFYMTMNKTQFTIAL